MERLTEEQIRYIGNFVRELHEKIPHSGTEDNESFIDDVREKGSGCYIFSPLSEGRLNGGIYIRDGNANIILEVSARISLEGDDDNIESIMNSLNQIAKDTGTHVISDDTWDEVRRYIGCIVPLFSAENLNLTVDGLITGHMVRASQAANALYKSLERYIINPN